MTEIPKAAIEAAAGKIAELRVYDNDLNYSSEEIALAALQAAAQYWYDPNEFAYGAGFRDGIEAAAKKIEEAESDDGPAWRLASLVRALTPQAKP